MVRRLGKRLGRRGREVGKRREGGGGPEQNRENKH